MVTFSVQNTWQQQELNGSREMSGENHRGQEKKMGGVSSVLLFTRVKCKSRLA
jgi:hypothetical protein